MKRTILTVMGTRPEAIKLAPVIAALNVDPTIHSVVCSTGQHREMLVSAINNFNIEIDHKLDLMAHNQSLSEIAARSLEQVGHVISKVKPDALIVQGDTTTAFTGALSAFYAGVPVFHVEAGLRSGNIFSPYPEEFNRRAISLMGDLHFAPTTIAVENLKRDGIAEERIFLTGNTGIDTLFRALEQPNAKATEILNAHTLNSGQFVLCTIHRRENFGAAIDKIFSDLNELSEEIAILLPLHLNPNVRRAADRAFGTNRKRRMVLIEPVEYPAFVHLLQQCHFVITDSGGIQEEAATLGKPLLIMRDNTERSEAIDNGNATLCPPLSNRLLTESRRLLSDKAFYAHQAKRSTAFGDGRAAAEIMRIIANRLALMDERQ